MPPRYLPQGDDGQRRRLARDMGSGEKGGGDDVSGGEAEVLSDELKEGGR